MYYNGKDAALYINDKFIHEAVTFEYTESQQKMPVYGYKSVQWDDVLLGDIIIQGGFTMNFQDNTYEDQQGNLRTFEVINELTRHEGSDDTVFTPPISGEAPIKRNKVDMKLIYTNKIFRDKHNLEGNINTNMGFNWTQDKEYQTQEGIRIITIKDAVITAHTTSIQIDASPIATFYSFIARKVEL
tara:strand:+ start:263 stop:820 length:558 start_codon:yes stop_codon:yes gene_type:complete